jgi:hypothetical protein
VIDEARFLLVQELLLRLRLDPRPEADAWRIAKQDSGERKTIGTTKIRRPVNSSTQKFVDL